MTELRITPQDSAQNDHAVQGMPRYMEFFAELPTDRQEAHLTVWLTWLRKRLVADGSNTAAMQLPEVTA